MTDYNYTEEIETKSSIVSEILKKALERVDAITLDDNTSLF